MVGSMSSAELIWNKYLVCQHFRILPAVLVVELLLWKAKDNLNGSEYFIFIPQKQQIAGHFCIVPLWLAPGNPTLWHGVPVASIQKSFGSSGRDWKPWKKIPIPCKFCTHRFIRHSSTSSGKVRINPLMANIRNPDFLASPVANAAWFVVVRPCCLNRDLLSGPKGN